MTPHRPPAAGQRGFTLIEMLIVVAIIAVIVAIAIPGLLTAFDRARQGATAATLRSYGLAIQSYSTDNSFVPRASSIVELRAMLRPYSDTLPIEDNWHYPLVYASDGEHYSISSNGKDGIDGADITPETRTVFSLDIIYSDGSFTARIE